MTPNMENNPIQQFFTFQKLMVFTPIMIGTLLIVVAIRRIIKPIRELSNAAKEVANGHFHIQVPVRGNDELAQLSHNFNQMTKELEANEYLHRNFVSNVSHEFKTPITSLKGYARLLKKTNCTEQQRYEYASIIISESERLSQLSSNLLKLSELENHAIVLKKETYSVTDSVRDVLLLLQQQWEEKQLQLQLHMDEVHVIADQELMFQVWLNLLSNAIKFSNEGDFLRIIITEAEEDIIVSIQDAGIGMSNEQQAKIFQRFYKADTSRNTTGTGLGLSIVKKIVELHNGDIQIESEIGKGSIFTVRLPKM